MLTDVVKKGQAETSTEGLIPLPGDDSPRIQGGAESPRRPWYWALGRWGGQNHGLPAPVLCHLPERMGLCRCVTQSRVFRCGDDPGLFKCASIESITKPPYRKAGWSESQRDVTTETEVKKTR